MNDIGIGHVVAHSDVLSCIGCIAGHSDVLSGLLTFWILISEGSSASGDLGFMTLLIQGIWTRNLLIQMYTFLILKKYLIFFFETGGCCSDWRGGGRGENDDESTYLHSLSNSITWNSERVNKFAQHRSVSWSEWYLRHLGVLNSDQLSRHKPLGRPLKSLILIDFPLISKRELVQGSKHELLGSPIIIRPYNRRCRNKLSTYVILRAAFNCVIALRKLKGRLQVVSQDHALFSSLFVDISEAHIVSCNMAWIIIL